MEGTAVERTSGIAGEQSLAERVNAYILTQHSSIHAVAKEVGYSRTSVSRYLSGKYDSCAASLEEKLAEFREQLGKDKNRERAREHQKDRGQSL